MSMKKKYFPAFCCIIFLFVFFSGCQKKSDLTEENKGSEDKIAIAAATPPMGWNSWNCFQADINEEKIRAVVDAMIATGMKDARLFVEWGVDYLKYDWCNHASINYSPDIDKISISGGQGKEIFYEAESPENTLGGSGNGAAVIKELTFKKDNKATVSGKKASNIGNNSGSLQFNNIDAPSDGEYQMKIYYSNPDFPFRRAYISVNSETAVEADMPFPGEVVNGSPVIALEEPPQAPPAGGVPGGPPPAHQPEDLRPATVGRLPEALQAP
jgi:hypothetical protein